MTTVSVFGKPGCGKCEAAKKKLQMMGIPYGEVNATELIVPHDGWRDDHSVDVMAVWQLTETLPIIQINDDFMDYPQAMKRLKGVAEEFKLPPMIPVNNVVHGLMAAAV